MVGQLMRQRREERGMTQEQAAMEIGCDRGYLSKVENGERPAKQDLLERAAAAYKAPDLLTVEDKPFNPPYVGRQNLAESLQWLREEAQEALDAAEKLDRAYRHGRLTPRQAERYAEQIYDLFCAAGTATVGAVTEADADFETIRRNSEEKAKRARLEVAS